MDDLNNCVITAIGDIRLEGSIAASLHRLGWNVICRATSREALLAAIRSQPGALVISSEDFRALREVAIDRHVTIDANAAPLTDGELRDLMRSVDTPVIARERTLTHTHSRLSLVASNGRTVGASTIALNIAQEFSYKESSTLLLDCNQWSPYLSRHLSINGINREITRTLFGFSAGEIISNSALVHHIHSLPAFKEIVIDFGQLREPGKLLTGRRVEEEIFAWAIHSDSNFILVSRCDPRALTDAARMVEELRRTIPHLKIHILLTLTSVMSNRERSRLHEKSSSLFGAEVTLISRDRPSLAVMEEQGATLAACAPKSRVLRELRELTAGLA